MSITSTPPVVPQRAAPQLTRAHEPLGCRAHEVLARVGDKWSVYIIHVLGEAGTLRFGELKRCVEGISQRMLTVTLRSLERDGLVSRAMYPEMPPRVEYALTPLAMTLRGIVGQLVEWSQANLPAIDGARARYDAQVPGWAPAED
ncbi:winged helix-turn-helix transcriptional regulator [Longimicrobium terrae]|uniref:DNA-binding HxlR family transcriptional regulator n=1 Tax=Longimicrobium terrae TaxID=1639882 RepID=A0A841GWY4_9BACT|nr:helix-turn-helix domain-containing protein [Longimicrobium terrae]MBB4636037.1 DNA-binding HxlR family transcriptional regulator [Longimicrobium terrae]MBB6070433.1 DNA-binding HxlR family transcriptional regulator [Longimicrobium terrae]NNC30927.1 helix-turn-helix transcriptional regulator [Longimicrobium terrae]